VKHVFKNFINISILLLLRYVSRET